MYSTPVDLSFSYLRSAVEASLDIKKDQVDPNNDFATDPLWIFLYMRKVSFSFLSVQCESCNSPRFNSNILRHSGIWGAADE